MAAPSVPTINVAATPNELRLLLDAAFVAYAAKIVELEDALQAVAATISSTTEGPGLPNPATRKSGDMHYDTTAKFWNRITEGVWQQQP